MNKKILLYLVVVALGSGLPGGILVAQQAGPGLELIRPRSGETLRPGQEYLVEWTDTAHHPGYYRLDYSVDGGVEWVAIDSGIQRKSYLWKVPVLLSDRCRMRVTTFPDTVRYLPTTTKSGVGLHWAEFDPTGRRIAISSGTTELRIWNARTGGLYFEPPTRGYVPTARFSADGELLATLDSDSTIVVYDLNKRDIYMKVVAAGTRFEKLAFLGDVDTLIASSETGLTLYDTHTGAMMKEFSNLQMLDIASERGRVLVQEIESRKLAILDFETGARFELDYEGPGSIHIARISPNGILVSIFSRDRDLEVWEVDSETLKVSNEVESIINGVGFSPGDTLLFGLMNQLGVVRIWNSYNGDVVSEITLPPLAKLHRARFGPQGKRLVTCNGGSDYGSARIWDVLSGKLIADYPHTRRVYDAEISPDNSSLLTVEAWRAFIHPFELSGEFRDSVDGVFRIGYQVGVEMAMPELEIDLTVSPNPTSGSLSVTFNAPDIREDGRIRVLSCDGQVVLNQRCQMSGGYQKMILDVSSLPPGVYWVRLEGGEVDDVSDPFIRL